MKLNRPLLLIQVTAVLMASFAVAKCVQAAPLAKTPLNNTPTRAAPLVMGYYPSYREIAGATNVRFDRFTHVIQAFITADAEGKAVVPPAIATSTLIETAHARGVKVILALSGGTNGTNFGLMVRDPAKSARFIRDVVQIMTKCGANNLSADGLAVDWEMPEAGDKAATTDFITRLRAAMLVARRDSLLILVVNASPFNAQGYDGPKLRSQIDYLHIMSYDFHGPWDYAGHHTSLYQSQADALNNQNLSYSALLSYWRDVQGFGSDQILFGIAGYGRGFKARAWGEKAAGPSEYPEISFSDLRGLIGHGWNQQWDDQAHAPWLQKTDNSERISYDDEQSVADKARWMKANGLPGFFSWEVAQEYAEGDNLLSAAAQKSWDEAPDFVAPGPLQAKT